MYVSYEDVFNSDMRETWKYDAPVPLSLIDNTLDSFRHILSCFASDTETNGFSGDIEDWDEVLNAISKINSALDYLMESLSLENMQKM